jgi:hypothetical protein
MDPSTSRSAARVAVPVLLALLISGCADQTPTSTAASTTAASTTTAAPTTTTVPPLNAKELAWLKGVTAVRTKIENSFKAKGGAVSLTRAIVLEYKSQLASWGRQLRRLGAPSDRLQPAYTLVRKVIQTFDKGAKCYARAADVISVGGSVGSDLEVRMFEEALDCGHAAEGNGANVLYKADAKGDELKAKYG